MALKYEIGDMFSIKKGVLVIPVNTKGVAGAGVAKICAIRYPRAVEKYRTCCKLGLIEDGGDVCYLNGGLCGLPDLHFLWFATKEDWRDPSEIEWIKRGLDKMVDPDFLAMTRINQDSLIGMPILGCGRGSLSEDEVIPIMVDHFEKHVSIAPTLFLA